MTDLYVQPEEADEKDERQRRLGFVAHFFYADPYAGPSEAYDPQGDYNCGRCFWADGHDCRLVHVRIDRIAGSCGDWEGLNAGAPKIDWPYKSAVSSGYGVAKNGIGFGCKRCPYASRAHQPDSRGRDLYCGKGDFRVFADACCVLNGASVVRRSPLYASPDNSRSGVKDVQSEDRFAREPRG